MKNGYNYFMFVTDVHATVSILTACLRFFNALAVTETSVAIIALGSSMPEGLISSLFAVRMLLGIERGTFWCVGDAGKEAARLCCCCDCDTDSTLSE